MRCEERFFETYGRDYEGIAFCPYRICPIGAHSDHNFGKITGLAIDTLAPEDDLLVMAGDNLLDFSLASYEEVQRTYRSLVR